MVDRVQYFPALVPQYVSTVIPWLPKTPGSPMRIPIVIDHTRTTKCAHFIPHTGKHEFSHKNHIYKLIRAQFMVETSMTGITDNKIAGVVSQNKLHQMLFYIFLTYWKLFLVTKNI